MKHLLRLYPRAWRDRYGEEFEALLEQRSRSLRDSVDIVRGALDARLHVHRGRNLMRNTFIHLAGLSLLLAGSLSILGAINRYGFLLSSGPIPTITGTLTPPDVMRGYIPLFLLIGIAGIWQRARSTPSSGGVGALITMAFTGVEGGLAIYVLAWAAERFLGMSWYTSALRHGTIAVGAGCLCLGVLAVGIALFRRRIVPGWTVFPLAVGMLAFIALVVAIFASDPTTTSELIFRGQVYVYLAFGVSWLPLGLALLMFGSGHAVSDRMLKLGTR